MGKTFCLLHTSAGGVKCHWVLQNAHVLYYNCNEYRRGIFTLFSRNVHSFVHPTSTLVKLLLSQVE